MCSPGGWGPRGRVAFFLPHLFFLDFSPAPPAAAPPRPPPPAFHTEVQQSADALTALAELTATAPPPALRARLLAAIAAEQPPVAS
ncbi:hypothetical protein [Nocardia farcinica]|uniref:hypothetical protein n=1 Tax=Nocardia farcinica TaxID=37329 RepID=UPI0024582D98|nr:hypothetical protein [Nocardia farcinica]